MCGAQDSKVLVTTRSEIVARTMGVSSPYVLSGLTREESWSLLKKVVTSWGDSVVVDQILEPIGEDIAGKCKGVPLAIRTLGGLLQTKREESEWLRVLNGKFWKLCEDEDSIMPVLKLSYKNLSPQLRQCFAFCCIYPKDWTMEKKELIQLWMAQGYLECSAKEHLMDMEDVGNQLVKILLMRSFFQDVEIHGDDIVRFKMHDLMHDLATQVGGNDCCHLDSEAKRIVGRPMHVSFHPKAVGLLKSLNASRLRTLIRLSCHDYSILSEERLSVISDFRYLRILSLLDSSLGKWSHSIRKMKHLRYLSLWRCTGLEGLSKSISNLVFLQKLYFCYYEEYDLSPKSFSKLMKLRYHGVIHNAMIYMKRLSSLHISLSYEGCRYLPPLERLPFLKSLELDSMTEVEYIYYEEEEGYPVTTFFPSLETLSLMRCRKLKGWCRIGEDFNETISLPPFPRLTRLHIYDCGMMTRMPTFPKLEKSLNLSCCSGEPLEATLKCQSDITPLSMLKSLDIGGDVLIEKCWIQNLTSLEHLDFYQWGSQAFEKIEISSCLPSLLKVTFYLCRDLKALPDWICNLTSLQHITMSHCWELASLPEGMPRLTKLHTLQIEDCPLLIEECKGEGSAVRAKIAHIPNVGVSL